MILIALILQHQQIAPLRETESALFAPFRIEEDRVGEVDQLVIRCSLKSEETAEHKSAFERADFTLYFAVIPVDVFAAFQLVLAVCAPVVGGDFDRHRTAAFFKGHFLFDHDIPARDGRDNDRVLAIRDALRRPDVALALGCDILRRPVGKHDLQIICCIQSFADRRIDDIRAAHLFKHGCKRIFVIFRREGIGVYAVISCRTLHRCSVYI